MSFDRFMERLFGFLAVAAFIVGMGAYSIFDNTEKGIFWLLVAIVMTLLENQAHNAQREE